MFPISHKQNLKIVFHLTGMVSLTLRVLTTITATAKIDSVLEVVPENAIAVIRVGACQGKHAKCGYQDHQQDSEPYSVWIFHFLFRVNVELEITR